MVTDPRFILEAFLQTTGGITLTDPTAARCPRRDEVVA
jgi:hypothetical protein